jgi:hypothetical protein
LEDLQQTKKNTFLLEPHLTKKKKKKRRNKTLKPQIPSPLKASPHCFILRKQEGSSTTRCQLQTCTGETEKQDWMIKE